MKQYMPALALTCLTLGIIGAAQLSPPDRGVVIAVYPAGISPEELWHSINDANAVLLEQGPVNNSYVLWSETPGLPGALAQGGARMVLSYYGAAGCGFVAEDTTLPNAFAHPSNLKKV